MRHFPVIFNKILDLFEIYVFDSRFRAQAISHKVNLCYYRKSNGSTGHESKIYMSSYEII